MRLISRVNPLEARRIRPFSGRTTAFPARPDGNARSVGQATTAGLYRQKPWRRRVRGRFGETSPIRNFRAFFFEKTLPARKVFL